MNHGLPKPDSGLQTPDPSQRTPHSVPRTPHPFSTTCPSWTPAQRAAVKPWGIACLSLWVAEMLSILTLSILLIASVPIGPRVMIFWVGATIVGRRLVQIPCMNRVKRVVGEDWGPSARRSWRSVAILTAAFTIGFLVVSR